jgi:BirA family biotin operon repressor/biotin-[acetyl-CoA-carboxylase] ligase
VDQTGLERAVRAAGIEAPPRYLEETGSTNSVALGLAAAGAPDWTVVAAGHQTEGRGRLGRSWADAPGKALMFSVVIRPDLRPERSPLLSLRAAVESIAAVGHPRLRSKWPNDLMVGERKAGGILVGAHVSGDRVDHAVVGVGLNVAMEGEDFPPQLRGRATSLRTEGIPADAPAILTAFLSGLRIPRSDLQIVAAYRLTCATLGRRVRARIADGSEIQGRAIDLDGLGGLVVSSNAGRRTIAFGDVAHLG